MEISTSPNVGVSFKIKQERLYTLCHDYLIDNFHKFSEANKLKVALVLASKMAPSNQLDGAQTNNQKVVVYVTESNGTQSQGKEGRLSTQVSVVPE